MRFFYFFKQIVPHIRRVLRARRFGVPFVRRGSFELPGIVTIGKREIRVSTPQEQGAKADFLTCFLDDEYGLSSIDFPVRTVIDIGANIGFFSMAARAYFPDAMIHAYEPNPRIVGHSVKNADAAQFNLFPQAVGATAGFVTLDDSGDSNQARTIQSSDGRISIPQVSLATAIERLGGQIDLAKIDCEGAEWDLFSETAAWHQINHVRMEYHLWGKHTYGEVEQSLDGLGFHIHHHAPAGEWGIVWASNKNALRRG